MTEIDSEGFLRGVRGEKIASKIFQKSIFTNMLKLFANVVRVLGPH